MQRQIGKLNDTTYTADEPWITQTASFVREFFGEESDEYAFISKFRFRASLLINKQGEHEENKGKAIRFIKASNQRIEDIGLFQPPKQNILRSIKDDVLLPIAGVVIAGVFWFSYYIGNVTSVNERYELKDSLREEKNKNNELNNKLKKITSILKDTTRRTPH